ncbi:hypothetical protein VKT23_008036 [Stygiomarasmius scandens]|uniref:Uncharacterized protein n=1 Tax=Marasmiellus scandens TaxID=2682957 RepID=A0ABR1JJX8_9AGAR
MSRRTHSSEQDSASHQNVQQARKAQFRLRPAIFPATGNPRPSIPNQRHPNTTLEPGEFGGSVHLHHPYPVPAPFRAPKADARGGHATLRPYPLSKASKDAQLGGLNLYSSSSEKKEESGSKYEQGSRSWKPCIPVRTEMLFGEWKVGDSKDGNIKNKGDVSE